MRIFISILGICSHMMLKDKVECQDKLTRALSKAAAATGLLGQTLHASTTRSERLVPAMGYTAFCFVQVDLKLKGPQLKCPQVSESSVVAQTLELTLPMAPSCKS